jgi:predicted TIM-barrel enzyme
VEAESTAPAHLEPLCSLPIVGETTVEDAVFYVAVGAVAVFGWVPWSTAGLIGSVHALHQRARNVVRTGAVGEARAGVIEAVDDVL